MTSKKLSKSDLKKINEAASKSEITDEDLKETQKEVKEEKPKKKRRGRKKKENYVDPEQFKNGIKQYYVDEDFTDDLGKNISDIANRLGFAPNFINYTYKEEMIGDAIIKMINALKNKKYNPEKGNAFSYFTRIAFNAFCNRIKKEKRTREAITGYQDQVYETLVHTGNIPQDQTDESGDSDDY